MISVPINRHTLSILQQSCKSHTLKPFTVIPLVLSVASRASQSLTLTQSLVDAYSRGKKNAAPVQICREPKCNYGSKPLKPTSPVSRLKQRRIVCLADKSRCVCRPSVAYCKTDDKQTDWFGARVFFFFYPLAGGYGGSSSLSRHAKRNPRPNYKKER